MAAAAWDEAGSAGVEMMGDAARIGKALGGRRVGNQWICRCPLSSHGQGRGDRNPSLSLADGEKGLLVKCFAGCDPLGLLGEFERRGLLDGGGGAVVDYRRPWWRKPAVSRAVPPLAPDERVMTLPEVADMEAMRLWRDVVPVEGTVAERYLGEHRVLPGPYPRTLGFVDGVLHKRTGRRYPALVAAVNGSGPETRVVAVQVTFLGRDGRKAGVEPARWNVGKLYAGAVRLGEPREDDGEVILGIAEGVETALAAQILTTAPMWACLGASRLATVWIPEEVRRLHIFCDNDKPGIDGGDAARSVHLPRRGVTLRKPPMGFKDYNEVQMERALP